MLINAKQLQSVSNQALAAMQLYLHGASLGPRIMIPDEAVGLRNLPWAVWFARIAGGGAVTQRFKSSLPQGYGSWLVRLSAPGGAFVPMIAINSSQIRAWAGSAARQDQPFREALITARCVYHEVGHIRLHGHLIRAGGPAAVSGGLAPQSTPEEEEEAWVFTFILLGMIVGDYAEGSRLRIGRDDSPARLI